MPKAKPKTHPRGEKPAPKAHEKTDQAYRYRDSDSQSISVTFLTSDQGRAARVLVNGVSPY